MNPKLETVRSDSEFFAIGNEIEKKYGATLIYNNDLKVWSCNMVRDLEPLADIEKIETFYSSKEISFVRVYLEDTQTDLVRTLLERGYSEKQPQVGFWLDCEQTIQDYESITLELVKTDEERRLYLELHQLECLEHNTPPELIDRIGQQRLNKNLDSRMRWYLVYNQKDLVGSIGLLLLGESARIKNPYTMPKNRGKGFGSLACMRAINEAKDIGVKGVSVYAQPESGGFKLYTKLGFREIIRHRIFLKS